MHLHRQHFTWFQQPHMVLKGCLSAGIWNKDIHIQTRQMIHWRSQNYPIPPLSMYLGICIIHYTNVLGTSDPLPTSMYTIENWGQNSNFPDLWSTCNQSVCMYNSTNAILEKYTELSLINSLRIHNFLNQAAFFDHKTLDSCYLPSCIKLTSKTGHHNS